MLILNPAFFVILLVIAFYAIFIAYSDFDKFSSNIEQFKFEFLPLILFFSFVGIVVNGFRQNILLKTVGIKISIKQNILLYLAGLSMIITPGGAGQAIKSYYLKKKFGYNISKTLPLVFVEKFQDFITLVSILSFLLIFIQINEIIILDVIMILLITIIYITFRIKGIFNKIVRIFKKISRLNKFLVALSESYESLHAMTSPKTMFKNWFLGILSWSFEAVAIYLVFLAFDVNLGFILTTLITYSAILLGGISLIPAGVGLTEISATTLLENEGIELSLAISIILMMRVVTIWFSTTLGFITTKFFISK